MICDYSVFKGVDKLTPYVAVLFAMFTRRHRLSRSEYHRLRRRFKTSVSVTTVAEFLNTRHAILEGRLDRLLHRECVTYIERTAHD